MRAFVEYRCNTLGLPRGAALRVELIAEELFVNAVDHGYRGDASQDVSIGLRDAGAEVELAVEDRAAEFNPFAEIEAPHASSNPDERPIGRLGRALVVGLSTRRQYVRVDGGNRITVAVLKSAGGTHRG